MVPFVDGIAVPHAAIAPSTNRKQIVDRCLAAFAFGDIVSALVIKHSNLVATPTYFALVFKHMSKVGNPHLFRKGLGDLLFAIGVARKIPKLSPGRIHICSLPNVGFILIYLKRRRRSRERAHVCRRRIHVVGILLIMGPLGCNRPLNLTLVEELWLEPFTLRVQDKCESHQRNHQIDSWIHC